MNPILAIRRVLFRRKLRRAAERSRRDNKFSGDELERHAAWLHNLKSNPTNK